MFWVTKYRLTGRLLSPHVIGTLSQADTAGTQLHLVIGIPTLDSESSPAPSGCVDLPELVTELHRETLA